MKKIPCVYILSNPRNTVLYTGVTSNLKNRIWQHKQKLVPGFTSRYNCRKLIYFEVFEEMTDAIAREKQIKGGSRKKKEQLINSINPEWKDLYDEI